MLRFIIAIIIFMNDKKKKKIEKINTSNLSRLVLRLNRLIITSWDNFIVRGTYVIFDQRLLYFTIEPIPYFFLLFFFYTNSKTFETLQVTKKNYLCFPITFMS